MFSESFALGSPFFMFYTFRFCLLLLILVLLWLWKGKKKATFYWRERRTWRRLEGLTAGWWYWWSFASWYSVLFAFRFLVWWWFWKPLYDIFSSSLFALLPALYASVLLYLLLLLTLVACDVNFLRLLYLLLLVASYAGLTCLGIFDDEMLGMFDIWYVLSYISEMVIFAQWWTLWVLRVLCWFKCFELFLKACPMTRLAEGSCWLGFWFNQV